MSENEKRLVEMVSEMEEDEALALAQEMLEGGGDPLRVLELCREAMDIVGKRFEKGEYFLPELILAGELLDQIGAMAKPLLNQTPGEAAKRLGRVLIGTVHGDPQGYERAWKLLRGLKPDLVTVEVSRFSLRYRQRREGRWQRLLQQALAELPAAAAGHLAIRRLAAQITLPFEVQVARERGAELIRSRVEKLGGSLPVILTGDFNCATNNQAYKTLVAEGFFTDTWMIAKERRGEGLGTFNGFKATPKDNIRIDWILARGKVEVSATEIVTFTKDGMFPSDHFPLATWLPGVISDRARESRQRPGARATERPRSA